jgi:hypothetical protein
MTASTKEQNKTIGAAELAKQIGTAGPRVGPEMRKCKRN